MINLFPQIKILLLQTLQLPENAIDLVFYLLFVRVSFRALNHFQKLGYLLFKQVILLHQILLFHSQFLSFQLLKPLLLLPNLYLIDQHLSAHLRVILFGIKCLLSVAALSGDR